MFFREKRVIIILKKQLTGGTGVATINKLSLRGSLKAGSTLKTI